MKFLTTIVLCTALVLGLSSFHSNAFGRLLDEDPRHKAAHMIIMGPQYDECTASAIGPHAILTAHHCESTATSSAANTIHVDLSPLDYHILYRIEDGNDHVILLLDGPEFPDQMGQFYNPATYRDNIPSPGDSTLFFLYGDGEGVFPPTYKSGVGVTWRNDAPRIYATSLYFVINIHAIPGDSGAAVYNNAGQLVTLVTFQVAHRYMGGYPMNFTQDQLNRAKSFGVRHQ